MDPQMNVRQCPKTVTFLGQTLKVCIACMVRHSEQPDISAEVRNQEYPPLEGIVIKIWYTK